MRRGPGRRRRAGEPVLPPSTPTVQGGIALQMTECDVVWRAGATEKIEFGNNERGERAVMLTFTRGPRPGVYRFAGGRLVSIERAPAPPAAAKRPRRSAGAEETHRYLPPSSHCGFDTRCWQRASPPPRGRARPHVGARFGKRCGLGGVAGEQAGLRERRIDVCDLLGEPVHVASRRSAMRAPQRCQLDAFFCGRPPDFGLSGRFGAGFGRLPDSFPGAPPSASTSRR